MSDVLFLAHRIPYPPNKGDKIRSWHWLESLTRDHAVHLGAFIDDERDMQYVKHLEGVCSSSYFETVQPLLSRLRAVRSAVVGRSLTEGIYRSAGMRRWVERTVAERDIRVAFGFSSGVAPYLMESVPMQVRRVLDLCDIDSDKWRQFAATTSVPMSWVYGFEHRRLARAERRWVEHCDAVLVVSRGERALLEAAVGSCPNAHVVGNGVDSRYFDPAIVHPDPYADGAVPVVFTGAMNYWANVEAAEWFVREVLPALRRAEPAVVFAIVGSNPDPRVTALGREPGVLVTGSVPDVRPYVQHARCAAIPLRIARGVQNKVLEAMALAKPIVATPESVAGLAAHAPVTEVDVESEPSAFAAAVIRHLRGDAGVNQRARQYAIEHFNWATAVDEFKALTIPHAAQDSAAAVGSSQ